MGYGFNNNTYVVLRGCEYRDVFSQVNCKLYQGEEIGSAIANAIIVKDSEKSSTYGIEGNPYIDQMIVLGYISLKV